MAERNELTIICGANTQTLENVQGMTVGELRSRLTDVLNIPTPSQMIMNGVTVDDQYVLHETDHQLEFVRPAGTKG